MKTNETTKLLQTIGGDRCICGHLTNRHRKGRGEGHPFEGWSEVTGACRDCECQGEIKDLEEDYYDEG